MLAGVTLIFGGSSTWKLLLWPVALPLVAVSDTLVPASWQVTLPLHVPKLKAPVFAGAMAILPPLLTAARAAVPVKVLIGTLLTSLAVTVTPKGTPAFCTAGMEEKLKW